ncbi:MAG: hypothetical protein BWY25_01198 [Chloroflexi bacterium ADurb.Bin222]|nr:MAG: hypothetical protein BWY25_01198 [Chloroflexi bacterium ADurb.Bin222]
MPSLHPGLPGTKEAYGLSLIRADGSVFLPPKASAHYGLVDSDQVLLMTTHRGEGGFAVARRQTAARSVFARFMAQLSAPDTVAWFDAKAYALTGFSDGRIHLTPALLDAYHVTVGQRVMVVKSTTVVMSCTPVEIWERKFAQRGMRVEVENIQKLDVF